MFRDGEMPKMYGINMNVMKLIMIFSIELKNSPYYFYSQAQWTLGKESFLKGKSLHQKHEIRKLKVLPAYWKYKSLLRSEHKSLQQQMSQGQVECLGNDKNLKNNSTSK